MIEESSIWRLSVGSALISRRSGEGVMEEGGWEKEEKNSSEGRRERFKTVSELTTSEYKLC